MKLFSLFIVLFLSAQTAYALDLEELQKFALTNREVVKRYVINLEESKKDILLLKLQLDGKPNRLLPFAYNQESGQFTRINGEGQAEFKGIGVDLNFNIPLNQIIHYKGLLHRN